MWDSIPDFYPTTEGTFEIFLHIPVVMSKANLFSRPTSNDLRTPFYCFLNSTDLLRYTFVSPTRVEFAVSVSVVFCFCVNIARGTYTLLHVIWTPSPLFICMQCAMKMHRRLYLPLGAYVLNGRPLIPITA